ncbi:N-acetylneuraminate synthase [Muricauda sp. JGD-17]|uniref:N-acetylneuraminate synthase n=1 Tax=Flagellimonas ochracea TaxID=2696472 RepID=A0A964WXB7_9FLAO|nr:N-acetylneuraminate synthase family protein [Allomuricauda ochracea]NAY91643.1 N-acetylneuraminate synthase [Allomuricauda ochracea]
MLPTNRPYLIGETAFHHQGDEEFLRQLIDHGAKVGIDALKVHLLLNLEDYFVRDHNAFDILNKWLFSEKEWERIIGYANDKGLDLIALCNDSKAIDFVLNSKNLKIEAIEIHATGLNDYLLLERAAKFKGTVILGVGGSTLDEISYAIEVLNGLGQQDILLMYGFQNYPTKYEDINLQKMQKLKDLFGLPMGYADHTDPKNEFNEVISTLGMAMGVNVCEKHFTHVFGEDRIDSQAAISLDQLAKTKKLMGIVHATIGDGGLKMSEAELSYGDTGSMKKAIVANAKIKKGERITLEKIGFKRTNESTYMMQYFLPKIIGLTASSDIEADSFIDFSNIKYEFKKAEIGQFLADKKESAR